MKKSLAILLITLSNLTGASTIKYFRFDDVDAVKFKNKIILVEDLRDGFEKIDGVNVSDDTLSTSSDSKATIIFKAPSNSIFQPTIMGKSGGDMGGG